MKRYWIVDFIGQKHEVSKIEFYIHKSIFLTVPIAGLLVLIGILKDTFF